MKHTQAFQMLLKMSELMGRFNYSPQNLSKRMRSLTAKM